jgi:hypothetical protein
MTRVACVCAYVRMCVPEEMPCEWDGAGLRKVTHRCVRIQLEACWLQMLALLSRHEDADRVELLHVCWCNRTVADRRGPFAPSSLSVAASSNRKCERSCLA